MMIIGIDPGFSGAIAILDTEARDLRVWDMPIVTSTKGKTEIDLHGVLELLEPEGDQPHMAVVEQVAAMRGQGVSSMFRFGQGFGALQMGLAAHKIPVQYVTPAKWKGHFYLSRDKDVSRSLAMQRFPEAAGKFKRKKDDGRAEAALIALYGKEKLL